MFRALGLDIIDHVDSAQRASFRDIALSSVLADIADLSERERIKDQALVSAIQALSPKSRTKYTRDLTAVASTLLPAPRTDQYKGIWCDFFDPTAPRLVCFEYAGSCRVWKDLKTVDAETAEAIRRNQVFLPPDKTVDIGPWTATDRSWDIDFAVALRDTVAKKARPDAEPQPDTDAIALSDEEIAPNSPSKNEYQRVRDRNSEYLDCIYWENTNRAAIDVMTTVIARELTGKEDRKHEKRPSDVLQDLSTRFTKRAIFLLAIRYLHSFPDKFSDVTTLVKRDFSVKNDPTYTMKVNTRSFYWWIAAAMFHATTAYKAVFPGATAEHYLDMITRVNNDKRTFFEVGLPRAGEKRKVIDDDPMITLYVKKQRFSESRSLADPTKALSVDFSL